MKREVAELRARPALFRVEVKGDVDVWIAESHELAKSFAYSPQILKAAEGRGEFTPVSLPPEYLKGMGEHARARIAAAGVRLAAVINSLPISAADKARAAQAVRQAPERKPATEPVASPDFFSGSVSSAAPSNEQQTMSHWLNLNGNVRHNSSCRYYENTKRGRACSADEGKACGICGG